MTTLSVNATIMASNSFLNTVKMHKGFRDWVGFNNGPRRDDV